MGKLIRFYKLFMKKYIRVNLVFLSLALFESWISVFIPKAYQYIIDCVFGEGNHGLFSKVIIFIALAHLVIAVISYISGVLCAKMSEGILADVKISLFQKIVSQDMFYFDESKVGKDVSKIENDVNILESFVSNGFFDIFTSVLNFVLITYMMLKINLIMTIMSIVIMLFYIILSKKYIFKTKKISSDILEYNENILAFMSECFHKIQTIKMFTMENIVKKNYSFLQRDLIKKKIEMTKIQVKNIELSYMAFKSSEVLVWLLAGILIIKGKLTLGMLTAFLSYQSKYFEPIRNISELNSLLGTSLAAIERIFNLLDMNNEQEGNEVLPDLKDSVYIKDLIFSYDGKHILRGINLCIRCGESIAIVGKNGAGKSTLIKILQRLYREQSGGIYWDDESVDNYTLESVRKKIAILPQDVNLFSMSIGDNIGITSYNTETALKLIYSMNMKEFIEQLPEGINTYINENESNLSGGEKQKIGIIRALIKKADILILDEPSNSLDSEQRKLMNNILSGVDMKIVIVITHDLEEILKFPRVVFLDDGTIIADGSPQKLLEENKEFRDLFGGN